MARPMLMGLHLSAVTHRPLHHHVMLQFELSYRCWFVERSAGLKPAFCGILHAVRGVLDGERGTKVTGLCSPQLHVGM